MSTFHDFRDFFGSDWSVTRYTADNNAEWWLCCDTVTRWWCKGADVTDEIVTEAERVREANDGHSSAAYEYLCGEIAGYHDDSVPAECLSEAREDLSLDADDLVACGW